MRILVTGGAGFIGGHLVDGLLSVGVDEVIVVDNLSRGRRSNLEDCLDRISFVHADIRNVEILGRAMRGIDVVYHLAAHSTVLGAERNRDQAFSVNVLGTFDVLSVAVQTGVKRFIFASSREVYGEGGKRPTRETAPLRPKNTYGVSKAAGEMGCELFRTRGLETAILRLTNVYGPRDHGRVIPTFLQNALGERPLIVYGGDQILDFVWIGIVVDAFLKVGLGPLIREPLNIGSGRGTRVIALARRIVEMTKSRSRVQVCQGRPEEVRCFVADVRRACALLNLAQPTDPLVHLGDVLRHPASREISRLIVSPQ